MKHLIVLIIYCVVILFYACDTEQVYPTFEIYKLKDTSLYDNVNVRLSEDKKEIVGGPLSNPNFIDAKPTKLIQDYYMGFTAGLNSGYLSIDRKTYNSRETTPSIDSQRLWLIETDPFIEYYVSHSNCKPVIDTIDESQIYDTAYYNSLIRNGELEKYFDRLK